ncbi:Heat shock cognate 71 kDa protein [Camelus dromedarius]|uniref:Heat shock cognate 71 kDa protein n=1 Tax=Camelus dromedarius TaxID=9838 RepID=A0A5N4C6Q6_CAMDR|nr:Heat shock cognate 71 kDa protein [Camelus dromedarius]
MDKRTGKENKITIKNSEDHLSKEDMDNMVQEDEKYEADYEKQRNKISARNPLKFCALNVKAMVEDERLQGKIKDENNRRFLTSIMKSSTDSVRIRLLKSKNLNIGRKS